MNTYHENIDLQRVDITIDSLISPSDSLLGQALFEIHKGECFYTKTKIPFEKMHVDHIHPRALGGKATLANYFSSCKSINSLKGVKHDHIATNELLQINRLSTSPF